MEDGLGFVDWVPLADIPKGCLSAVLDDEGYLIRICPDSKRTIQCVDIQSGDVLRVMPAFDCTAILGYNPITKGVIVQGEKDILELRFDGTVYIHEPIDPEEEWSYHYGSTQGMDAHLFTRYFRDIFNAVDENLRMAVWPHVQIRPWMMDVHWSYHKDMAIDKYGNAIWTILQRDSYIMVRKMDPDTQCMQQIRMDAIYTMRMNPATGMVLLYNDERTRIFSTHAQ